MANKYRIYFFGLIAHIGANEQEKRFSAVIRDDDHEPVLLFGLNDEFALDNVARIYIEGLRIAPAEAQPTFHKYVPHIRTLMGGEIEREPANGTGRKAAFFHHAGGKLYAARLYEKKARHFLNHQEVRDQFVAVLNVLLLDLPQSELVIRAGPLRRRVRPDQCVMIANLDRPQPNRDPNTNPHVRKYSKITDRSDTDITMEEYDADSDFEPPFPACDWVIPFLNSPRGFVTAMHSECGNTDYP